MIEGVGQVRGRRAGREHAAGRLRIHPVEVDAVGAERRGVLGVGLRVVVVDAEVVLDGGEPLDHPAILLHALGRVALADQVRQERLTRSCRSEPASPPPRSDSARRAASIASTQATGSAPPASRARSRFFEASERAASTPGPDRSLASLPLAVHPRPIRPRRSSAVASTDAARASVSSATPALAGGPGLGPGLGQLGLPQPPLDAAEICRQPGHDRPRVPRPVLRRGGQARPRQPHQLRVGAARVEACQRVRQVGPLRLAVDLRRRPRPRTRAGR